MFVERLMNQGNAPLLEQVVKFASARHRLITENIANVDTPGYRQKDLSVGKFQAALRELADLKRSRPPGSVSFNGLSSEVENPMSGILYHDDNNRSMEHLQSDLAKNALMHNLAIELLRKQFNSLEAALRERLV